ncbi:VOC family protein [Streptomyces sp. NPDC093252]|uniref:VOC family protein n=1 Tax=Streptomyces sp. NPDC093252 TaxID=3154980 RepID=UPI00342683D9
MSTDGFTTCLWFDGQAEDAAHYYVSVFKDASLGGITRYGEGAPVPAGTVLTADFTLNGQRFVALNGGPQYSFTEAISFQIPCADQDEIDHYWTALTRDGGQPGPCGWLKDRYGVSWQVVPERLPAMLGDPDTERAARVGQALMRMGKLDLAELERAFDGT